MGEDAEAEGEGNGGVGVIVGEGEGDCLGVGGGHLWWCSLWSFVVVGCDVERLFRALTLLSTSVRGVGRVSIVCVVLIECCGMRSQRHGLQWHFIYISVSSRHSIQPLVPVSLRGFRRSLKSNVPIGKLV